MCVAGGGGDYILTVITLKGVLLGRAMALGKRCVVGSGNDVG